MNETPGTGHRSLNILEGKFHLHSAGIIDSYLLDAALAVAEKLPWQSTNPDTRAMVYTLQGDHERALAELRSIIDKLATIGWRHLEWEPVYEPLRSHPEFREMISELKVDKTLALQLERLREMERAGELAAQPAAPF